MLSLYARWMDDWETRLANRDTNRVVRPFEWGADWLGLQDANGNAFQHLARFVDDAVSDSDRFFAYEKPSTFTLRGSSLEFLSPVESPYPKNNIVRAEYFPATNHRGRCVLVLPQWNADAGSHLGLCKLLNRHGLSALRLSLAYHNHRMPPELSRADYHVSSNLGRTIHATRQSVIDARACLDWLESQGYHRLALLGTSLGSCVALLTTAHDPRVTAAVFNHVSMNFSDVVWDGLSCRHIQKTIHTAITREQLTACWRVISPSAYLDRLVGRSLKSLIVWAKYDTTFRPTYSRMVLDAFRTRNLWHRAVCLPCGHYTSAHFPFHIWDGLLMTRFLRNML